MLDRSRQIAAELPGLRRYARALLHDADRADDLVQDCVARALSRWALWRRRGPLRPWLFAIMHNLFVDDMRHRDREASLLSAASEASALADPTPAPRAPALSVGEIDRALAQLSDEQRETVLLVGLEGFRYAEVARMTGVAVGTVMSRLSRGRARLRLLLEDEGGGAGRKSALRRVK